MIRPMIHLGLRPVVLPLDRGVMEIRQTDPARPLFLDQSIADRYLNASGASSAVLVDRFRRASYYAAGGAEPLRGRREFLFSEENLVGLIHAEERL